MKVTILLSFHQIIVDHQEILDFKLVDEKELKKLRLSGKPVLLYKEDNLLWAMQLEKSKITESIITAFKNEFSHICFTEQCCCKKLSALPNPDGCPFVRDRDIQALLKDINTNAAYDLGMRIEKYDQITHAIQFFSLKGGITNWVKILDCSNLEYPQEHEKKYVNAIKKHELIVGLANNLYPQIENYEELKKFLNKKNKLI